MAIARKVPGLDYLAEEGEDPDVSAGVIQVIGPDGQTNSMEASVCKRLYPHRRPSSPSEPWRDPTCYHWDVVLPLGAHDDLWKDPQKLCRAYDAATFPGLRDLLISLTLRAPWLEAKGIRIHEFHQVVTGFAKARLAGRGLPTIIAIHVPSRSGRPQAGPIHWHCLIAARRWSALTGPSSFCREVLIDARKVLEDEWRQWRAEHVI